MLCMMVEIVLNEFFEKDVMSVKINFSFKVVCVWLVFWSDVVMSWFMIVC